MSWGLIFAITEPRQFVTINFYSTDQEMANSHNSLYPFLDIICYLKGQCLRFQFSVPFNSEKNIFVIFCCGWLEWKWLQLEHIGHYVQVLPVYILEKLLKTY